MVTTDDEMVSLKSQCVTPLLHCSRGIKKEDCPFAPVRTMEIVEGVRWLKKRTAPELRALLAHHRECSTQTMKDG